MLSYLSSLIRCPEKMDLSNAASCGIYEILLRVDNLSLVKNCSLVCKQWNEILNQRCFWVDKSQYDDNILPSKDLIPLGLDYRKLVVRRPFNRNLINDEWGSDTFRMDKRWKFNGSGRGFEVERPPIFFNNNFVKDFDDSLVQCCLSTSYFWSRKLIVVDLYDSDMHSSILDELCPTIVVSELVSHRSDCAAVYEMTCRLSNIPAHFIDLVESSYNLGEEDERGNCMFKRNIRFEQWQPQSWTRVECKFKKYPPGTRYIIIETGGKDEQFWAGNYGTKMAHCSVMVTTEFNRRKA